MVQNSVLPVVRSIGQTPKGNLPTIEYIALCTFGPSTADLCGKPGLGALAGQPARPAVR
jgi:hypothetical protein